MSSVVGTPIPANSVLVPAGAPGPPGATGPAGPPLNVKGTVATSASLPTSGNTVGDIWIAADTRHGWTWSGTAWIDIGLIQGPSGATGPAGPTGPAGGNAYTTTTNPLTVPAYGATTTVNVADPGFLVLGSFIYLESAGGGPDLPGILVVTGISGNTLTLLNPVQPS
jgi:hypothetical protein